MKDLVLLPEDSEINKIINLINIKIDSHQELTEKEKEIYDNLIDECSQSIINIF